MNYNQIIFTILIIYFVYLPYINNYKINLFEFLYNSFIWLRDILGIGIPNKCKHFDNESLICNLKEYTLFTLKNDTTISRPLKRGHMWESFMHHYFKKYSNMNKICLDIGANIGTHSVVLSKYFSKVYSFEPQKKIFNLLKKNIQINNCSNVKLYNYGLDKEENIKRITCFDDKKKNNYGSAQISNEGGCDRIKLKTLDSHNLEDIALIKIDIEGYEYNALLGGISTLKKYRPIIIFEEHKINNSNVFKLLNKINYNIRKISYSKDYIAIPLNNQI